MEVNETDKILVNHQPQSSLDTLMEYSYNATTVFSNLEPSNTFLYGQIHFNNIDIIREGVVFEYTLWLVCHPIIIRTEWNLHFIK